MTNDELNRAVALARGWRPKPGSNHQWIMPDDCPSGLPDVCADPAAWGALLAELGARLGADDEVVGLNYSTFFQTWHANVGKVVRADPAPGRALALAFLKVVKP